MPEFIQFDSKLCTLQITIVLCGINHPQSWELFMAAKVRVSAQKS